MPGHAPGVRAAEHCHVPRLPRERDHVRTRTGEAGDFLITDIKVDGESQFGSPGCIPGMAFAETAFAIKLRGDAARPRQFITACATSQSHAARNFQGVLIGHIPGPPPPGDAARLDAALEAA